ncbi:MAG: peptidoglycan bridge formation glycyltransferase FemA/FemB family protein [Spirochaetaceae bacterium]|nr:peptidoglycan bridge formation glycyltransferase FemA/FemB family protein [Spirochaetaceae bacterium]
MISRYAALTPQQVAVCDTASTFLQSSFWGAFKEKFGWKAHAFTVTFDGGEQKPLLVLTRRVARVLTLAYVPWGPELPDGKTPEDAALADIAAGLRPHLPGTAFVRFDLPWLGTDPLPRAPFKKAAVTVQAPDTVHVDLCPDEDAILARMKPKWRYNIRLGGRKVAVIRCGPERLADFYALLEETARRDHIRIHNPAYYRTLFDLAAAAPSVTVSLYLAEYEGAPVAGIVTLFRGKEAVYLYGASSNEHRNLMAPYALQWRAMRDAKAAGCAYYDLFGIPPNADLSHPMAGLYLFKTGFGGAVVHRPGCYDYAYNPLLTAAFRTAEKTLKRVRI